MARATASTPEPGKKRKRKRKDENSYTWKKSRTLAFPSHEEVDFQDQAQRLEEKILESRSNYNSICTLLGYLQQDTGVEEEKVITAVTLCRVFCRLLVRGKLGKVRESSGDEARIRQWLSERLQDFEQGLLRMLRTANFVTQSTALTVVMRLSKEKALHLHQSEDNIWQDGIFKQLIQILIEEGASEDITAEFAEKYVEVYNDVRYYTFACLGAMAFKKESHALVHKVLMIMTVVKPMPEQQGKTENFYVGPPQRAKRELYSLTGLKKQAQKAWMALLRQDLSKSQRKVILELMSHQIAPWFLKVEFLMDFMTDSFDFGGSTSLLSLSGLFYLMQNKNLDYPQFYQKLYSLLDSNLLHSKHRSRFFRLLDTFLASTHLPAALVGSFLKRLARLSLFAPPPGIVIVIPWIYNLLRSHPSCTVMIHRNHEVNENTGTWGDPFRQEEPDPMETDALESSLWEIEMLQSHYHPNVATIAKIISEQFTKQAYNPEDFLDHSYGTMLDVELSKESRKPPEIEYEIPKKIFTTPDAHSAGDDSLLSKLWKFD